MKTKRMISLFLLFSLLLSLLPIAQAANRGVYLSSDSSFFAQLNLNTAGMEKVKAAVSAGNYTTAKSELLQYYKTKFASYDPIPADSKDANRVFFAMNDTWSMSQNRIAETTIKGTGFNFYSFGKTTNTAGCYVLDILDRPDYAIQICTRENEVASHRPVLKCYDASGKLISEVVAAADAMIHKGKPDTNYGTDNVLYVKSGMTQNTNGTYLPYNINSRRVYMKFNVPSGTKHTELVIYARLHGVSGSTDNDSLPLYQFASFNTSWTESNLTWNYLVNLKAMGHYSWKDIPGGFDWKQPEGMSDYDWLDSNSRFYELVALAQTAVATTDAAQRAAYFAKLKEILLDFIADTNVRTGFPANRDRETSSRMMNFPYIYKQLLAENVLTANENKTILAYVYDELTFMDNGATIFDNSGGNHGASAYTNHSVYHLAGFYAAVAYWPEFKSNANWRKRYESRVDFVLTTLINSDGSYNEVSFGYPRGVLSTNSFLIYCMQERNDTSATGKKFINASILLARYLMDCSYPNGKNPYWGQGSTTSAISGHIKTFLRYLGSTYDSDPNVQALRYFVNNAEGTAPNTVAQYTPVKIVTDRTGWSADDSMLFMNAKSAGYHGHRDALAILYYYGGRSLLTDTGTTSASSTHPHYNFQQNSTRSHNTIEIDGKAQTWQKLPSAGANMGDITIVGNDSYSSVSSWTKANTNDISTTNASGATVTHSTDFTHYRHVSYMKELGEILFVSDKVVPADSASHSYTQNWHSAPYSNPTIAADAYDTGRTNFSSGANLLIAQVNGGSMTGSLQTGYDSSASATTTKYFQYKKTGSGTVTYQTVLYPMAEGTTATVQPTKITMSGTSDATALASRISVNDSSRPTVKTIYHYHAFESTPSTRSFDAFTTNAGTVTLVQDGNSKLHFAALSKGSSVSSGNTVVLKATATVTDLAATLENGVLSVESSDPSAEYATITVNFSGQTVHEVYYNGNSVSFTQAADGTVTIPRYPLVHFDSNGLLSDISQWTPHSATAAIKNGTMTGSLTGSDPYVKSVAAFAYPLQKGDVVEIRIKYNITSGTYSGLQFFWLTEDAPQYNGTNRLLDSATSYPTNEYTLVRLNIPNSSVGDVMTGLRVDPVGTGSSDYPAGTYTIDYIYVGPPEEAPSKEYTVTFKDAAGNILATQVVHKGETATYTGATPTKAYDGTYHYTFKGWDKDLTNITANITVTAQYNSIAHSYTYAKLDGTNHKASCSCGYSKNVAHTWNGGSVTTQPTCTAAGVKTYTCTVCSQTKTESVAVLGHSYTTKVTAPTCTAQGYTTHTCSRCSNSYKDTYTNATGHSYTYKATTNPTTSATGVLTGTCSKCSGTTTVTLPKLSTTDYNYAVTKAATCAATGTGRYTWKTTTYGSFYFDVTIAKTTNHSYDSGTITTQPTCTAAGVKTFTCSVCKGTRTESVAAKGHTEVIDKAVAATCTAAGKTEGKHCSVCNVVLVAQQTVPAKGHTEVIDKAVAATCTAAGKTEGKHCSVCNAVLIAQQTVPAKGHTEVIDKAVAATCTAVGKTEGKHCSVCNAVLVAQQTVPAKGHTEVIDKAVAATCTAAGKTEGKHCSVCNAVLVAQQTVPAKGHTELIDKAVAATCTAAGKTEGKHCSVCNAVLVAQQTVPAKGHTEVIDKAVAATCTAAGKTEGKHCSVCSVVLVAQQTVPAKGHTEVIDKAVVATCTAAGKTEGKHCSVCSVVLVAQQTVPAKGHTEVIDKAVVATCIETGLTEGKHCSVCGEVLTPQKAIPATGHETVCIPKDEIVHLITCKNCTAESEAAHSYTDGLCICGKSEIVEPIPETNWKLGHSLNLASDISVNLVIHKAYLEGFDLSTVYVESIVDTYDGNQKTGTEKVRLVPVENGDYYYFTLTGLTAVRMNDRIASTLHGVKEGQPYYSPVDEYSIAAYAYSQMNNPNRAESLKILCADLLRYGAKAQIFKAYRTDALADSAMTDAHRTYLSDMETVIFGNTNRVLNDLEGAPITWVGKVLNLESKVALRFVFDPANYNGDLSALTLRISYKDASSNTKTLTLRGPELYNSTMGIYAFTFDALLAAELRTVVSAQIYEGDTPLSATLQYSADTYGIGKTGTLLDLCKALFAYSDSAKAYFTSNSQ